MSADSGTCVPCVAKKSAFKAEIPVETSNRSKISSANFAPLTPRPMVTVCPCGTARCKSLFLLLTEGDDAARAAITGYNYATIARGAMSA